jgi:hypothetical protein
MIYIRRHWNLSLKYDPHIFTGNTPHTSAESSVNTEGEEVLRGQVLCSES